MNTAKEQLPEEKPASNLGNKDEHREFATTLEQYLDSVDESVFEENEKKTEKNIETKDLLYYVKTVCPLCGKKFESPKVRSKYLRMIHMDNDYCKYYEPINPLYYEMMVCSHCGFAYNEEIKNTHLSDVQRKIIKSRLQKVLLDRSLTDYGGVRNLDQAVETFLLSLLSMQGNQGLNSIKGMLYLKIAWLYRYKKNEAKESYYIEKALLSLMSAYKNEVFQEAQKEINITYLIAVLYFRTGKYPEAARWLERILRRQNKSVQPAVAKQARELWAEVRQILRKTK
ncbi:MAG: hypothetical protein A4E52_01274 [Pelotomaculum sp. PtaB.Bin013]|nr:MAG: hypothetical protein A4E52_01274 [Pelotomaculum sp. PtaB.Bin013]